MTDYDHSSNTGKIGPRAARVVPTDGEQTTPLASTPAEIAQAVSDQISLVVVGQEEAQRLLLIGLMVGGHVLFEDRPAQQRRSSAAPSPGPARSTSNASSSRQT